MLHCNTTINDLGRQLYTLGQTIRRKKALLRPYPPQRDDPGSPSERAATVAVVASEDVFQVRFNNVIYFAMINIFVVTKILRITLMVIYTLRILIMKAQTYNATTAKIVRTIF